MTGLRNRKLWGKKAETIYNQLLNVPFFKTILPQAKF